MRIVNVIEICNGSVCSLNSWPILEDQLSEDVIDNAIKFYAKCIEEKTGSEYDLIMDIFKDQYHWSNGEGYEVFIMFSNVNI